MINAVGSIVTTALRVPAAIAGEALKVARAFLGRDERLSEAEVEAAQEELKRGVRAQATESIETVKVAEQIRDHTVTAER